MLPTRPGLGAFPRLHHPTLPPLPLPPPRRVLESRHRHVRGDRPARRVLRRGRCAVRAWRVVPFHPRGARHTPRIAVKTFWTHWRTTHARSGTRSSGGSASRLRWRLWTQRPVGVRCGQPSCAAIPGMPTGPILTQPTRRKTEFKFYSTWLPVFTLPGTLD